jgi:hypothetical protein
VPAAEQADREPAIDVAFVGIGENGHLAVQRSAGRLQGRTALHPRQAGRGCRRQQVKEGWFGTLDQVPAKAITMSIRKIMSSEAIICTVPDKRKAKAVKAALRGRSRSKVPASILQRHPRASLYLDPDSAGLLGPTPRPLDLPAGAALALSGARARMKRFHLLRGGGLEGRQPEELPRIRRKARGRRGDVDRLGSGVLRGEAGLRDGCPRRTAAGMRLDDLRTSPKSWIGPSSTSWKTRRRPCEASILGGRAGRAAPRSAIRSVEALGDPGTFIDSLRPPTFLTRSRRTAPMN